MVSHMVSYGFLMSPLVRIGGVAVTGPWQHPVREMVEFLPCVFSSVRPRSVASVNEHIGKESVKVRWLGEQVQYIKAGASRVLEVGNLCKVMAYSIRLANTTKTPVVLIPDDIRGFFAFVGSPSKWTSRLHGCRLGLSDFTGRILAAMRQVAAPAVQMPDCSSRHPK